MLRLQLRGVGVRELDASPLAPVLDDGVTPIDLLDIEHVAYLSPKGGPRVRWRRPDRAHDLLVRHDAVDQARALAAVEQGALRPDLGVLLARHHVDLRPALLLKRVLDRVVTVEPLDLPREVLRPLLLQAVEDLFPRLEREPLVLGLDGRVPLLQRGGLEPARAARGRRTRRVGGRAGRGGGPQARGAAGRATAL